MKDCIGQAASGKPAFYTNELFVLLKWLCKTRWFLLSFLCALLMTYSQAEIVDGKLHFMLRYREFDREE